MKKNILIIDDDQLFRHTLKCGLQDDTASVYYAVSVQEAMLCIAQNEYALMIMDTQLTETDGIEALSFIRQTKDSVPIMILTSNDNLAEQLIALEIGAEVVLEKKADPLECMIGHARAIWVNNEPIDLTRKEFNILSYMAGNPQYCAYAQHDL